MEFDIAYDILASTYQTSTIFSGVTVTTVLTDAGSVLAEIAPLGVIIAAFFGAVMLTRVIRRWIR